MIARRDALFAVGSLASLAALEALAEGKAAPAGKTATGAAPAAGATDDTDALIRAAETCAKTGRDCIEHCIRMATHGDASMNECLATARQMVPMCEVLAEYVRQGSPHLKAVAALCAKVCRDCEAACKKHAAHHAQCKACMESCADCATRCEKL